MLKWSKYRKSDDMPPIAVEQITEKRDKLYELDYMRFIAVSYTHLDVYKRQN